MLEVNNLTVAATGNIPLIQNVSFKLSKGDCIGLTGSSGSGKTTIVKAIMGILPYGCSIAEGEIILDGKNIQELSAKEHRKLCGTVFGFIPQNPMTTFNPHMKIGAQLVQIFRLRKRISKQEALQLTKLTLKQVNLCDTVRVMNSFPDQLSGGMLQRVAVACLVGLNPKYIFADEPTSALDEDNKNLLLSLLQEINQNSSILFISHDTDSLKKICNETIIINKGMLIERQITFDLFKHPKNSWTKNLVCSSQSQQGGEWNWMDMK